MDKKEVFSGPKTVSPISVITTSTKTDSDTIMGCLDEVIGGVATGWAQDTVHLDRRLTVELLENGKALVSGEANLFRPDLAAAKIGDGGYGFKIPLPSKILDDKEHIITAQVSVPRKSLKGEIRIKINIKGAVTGLEDTCVAGWATMEGESANNQLEIRILESGEVVAHGIADLLSDHGKCGFRIPLPSVCLDGRDHTFDVREKKTDYAIGNITVTTPLFISNGPIISCRVAGVVDNSVFGWLRITDDSQLSALDLCVEAGGVKGGKVRIKKVDEEIPVPSGKTVSFFAQFSESGKPPEDFMFFDRQTGSVVGSIPISLKTNEGWGYFDRIEGIHCSGWALTAEGNMARVEVLVDGESSVSGPAVNARQDFNGWPLQRINCGFRLQLPAIALDGREHEISVRVVGSREPLTGSKRIFKYDPLFHIDSFSESHLSGWILNKDSDDFPIQLDAVIDEIVVGSGRSSFIREDVYKIHGRRCVGFYINLDTKQLGIRNSHDIRLNLAGTTTPALHSYMSTISVAPAYIMVKALENLGSKLKIEANGLKSSETLGFSDAAIDEVMRRKLIPKLIAELRVEMNNGKNVWTSNRYKESPVDDKVDIVVPVFKGYSETMACIHSVIGAKCNVAYELIVINDFSPDLRLTDELRSLAKEKKITLIENKKNLGFVATVNRGMTLHDAEGRDIILLNSDTVVPSGWLDGLQGAAYQSSNIGTVTPFSNRATICSIPRPQFDNDMIDDVNCQLMHDICAAVNGRDVVDIPTGIGFCMYIRRSALREVGLFDEQKWKKGYGEENDFCVKARALGWRNVAATGIFVQHHGSISFAEEKDERVRENMVVLNQMYPDYPATVQRFIHDDPLAVARTRINLELLKRKASRYVLHIGHTWGGGTNRAIRDLAKGLAAEGISSLIMEPSQDAVIFSTMDGQIPVSISLTNGLTLLVEALEKIGVFHIHIHQIIGYPALIKDLPALLGVKYDVSIHDYFFICPRVQLINDYGIFCGQPDVEVCESCCSAKPLEQDIAPIFKKLGGTVADWREFHGKLLKAARKVIAPSNDVCNRIQRYRTLDNLQLLAHPEPGKLGILRPSYGERMSIAVIGAIGPHKGSELLLRCAKYAKAKELPISFFIIGYTNMDDRFRELDNVVITGKYESVDLPKLIDACGCTIALFLSIWPETYSYTLSEALDLGLVPVAFDLGAFPERVEAVGRGLCIPFVPKAESIVETLLSLKDRDCDSTSATGRPIGSVYSNCALDYYDLTIGDN